MNLALVLLGSDELDIARTRNSIEEGVLSDEQIVVRPLDDTKPWSGIGADVVVLMRAGDRVCAGGIAALLDGLHDADVVLGGYRIAGAGHWGVDVMPPKVEGVTGLEAWAVAPPFELSAIAIRRDALPTESHPAPGLPGGEIALLHTALSSSPEVRTATIGDIVADVRARPVHLGDPTAMLERLRGVLAGPLGSNPVTASRVRRRALSLAYLESGPSVAGQFDADTWWRPAVDSPSALAVFRDLHWVLTCVAEAKKVADLGLAGLAESEPSDLTAEMPPDVSNMTATIESFQVLVGELTDTTHWLHAEVQRLNDQLDSRPVVMGQLVNETSTVDLARILKSRIANRVRRVRKRGVR